MEVKFPLGEYAYVRETYAVSIEDERIILLRGSMYGSEDKKKDQFFYEHDIKMGKFTVKDHTKFDSARIYGCRYFDGKLHIFAEKMIDYKHIVYFTEKDECENQP